MKIKIEFDPWNENRQSVQLEGLLAAAGLTVERIERRPKPELTVPKLDPEIIAKIKEAIA